MKKIAEIYEDNNGYIVIGWKGDLGRNITINNLQDEAIEVANGVAKILSKVEYLDKQQTKE